MAPTSLYNLHRDGGNDSWQSNNPIWHKGRTACTACTNCQEGEIERKKSEDKTHPKYNVLSIARKPMQTLTVSK